MYSVHADQHAHSDLCHHFRCVSPALFGAIYAASLSEQTLAIGFPVDYNIVFILYGVVLLALVIVQACLPLSIDSKRAWEGSPANDLVILLFPCKQRLIVVHVNHFVPARCGRGRTVDENSSATRGRFWLYWIWFSTCLQRLGSAWRAPNRMQI